MTSSVTLASRTAWFGCTASLLTIGALLCLQAVINRDERAMLLWGVGTWSAARAPC